ncbi:hypothetical protein F0562_023459 [Nyssa sinensis]|uniref:Retrotransposon gag domain-containing protein n=1 Tax=Nyssa sinensis TaxID=561372 RepID=A0A5J5BIC7_9ASTE|nr:hypothetical protein F0562_023459 [Nyssa sinensis]
MLGLVVGLETSAAVWRALENAFVKSSQPREFQLETELSLLQKGDMSLNEYLTKFKRLCDDLVAIGKPIGDEKKVFFLLKGLGPRYESFTTSMLKPPIPSYTDQIPLLQGHEAIKMAHSLSPYTPPRQTEAFVGQRISGGCSSGRGSSGDFQGELTSLSDWDASASFTSSSSSKEDRVPFNSPNIGDFPINDYPEALHDEYLRSDTLVVDQSINTEANSPTYNGGPSDPLPHDHMSPETSFPPLQNADSTSSQTRDISIDSHSSPVVRPVNSPPPSLVAPPVVPSRMELNTHPMLTRGKSRVGFTSLIASTNEEEKKK